MGRKVIFILLIVSWLNQAARSVKLTVACGTRYVEEGNSLECDCQAHFNNGIRPADLTVLWPGRSNNRRLTVLNVTRADNGTVFTCLMSGGGHKSTANYTLQVAYGPDNQHTAIYGPEVFITDGEKDFNLTCEATEVNPRPLYSWDGIKCRNNDTNDGFCVVNPKPPWDDGAEILCSARSRVSASIAVDKRYKLNLLYPPFTPPDIQGYKEVLSIGDKLHCRVSGGKPLVKKVNFSCSSDPPHEDQEDITVDKSVQSSVTIGSVETETYRMPCPYQNSPLSYPSETHANLVQTCLGTYLEELKIGLAVVLPVVCSVTIIVSIAAAVQVKKRKTRKAATNTWSSPRTRVRKVPDTYDNVVFSQVSNSSSLHMPEGFYNT